MNDGWLPGLTSREHLGGLLCCLIIELGSRVTLPANIAFTTRLAILREDLLQPFPDFFPSFLFHSGPLFGRRSLAFSLHRCVSSISFLITPLPPLYPQSLPELSNFNDRVLLKSLRRPKTSLKPLSPLTEQAGHPKYSEACFARRDDSAVVSVLSTSSGPALL